jgi:hypothetical protein
MTRKENQEKGILQSVLEMLSNLVMF